MKLAAIDIGSNAVRLQITNTIEFGEKITFKKLEYIRFPLRLGYDVFSTGRISEFNKARFLKLINAYKMIIDLYEVDQFYACATSAMRESENGLNILQRVKDDWGMDIEIIDGKEEARLINEAVRHAMDINSYLHVDVGGGSTELNYYSEGVMKASGSFKTGSVRRLNAKESPDAWTEISKWLKEETSKKTDFSCVGTGGNINKLFELSGLKSNERVIGYQRLHETAERLKSMTLDQRMMELQLNADRADVIIPASDIYLGVMKQARSKRMYVPDVGLKDGINLMLYERGNPSHGKIWVKN